MQSIAEPKKLRRASNEMARDCQLKVEPSVPAIIPSSLEELTSVVAGSTQIRISGSNSHANWRLNQEADQHDTSIQLNGLNKILEIEPQDQVVFVQAGAKVTSVNESLKAFGQCLPWLPFESEDNPTIGGAISLGLPHLWESECGSWRDWTLGLKIMRPDGTIAKCGSAAVKNVAGYDLPRFFVGSRGYLGIIVEVILKTFPTKALPEVKPQLSSRLDWPFRWVQRVHRTDIKDISHAENLMVETASATIYEMSDSVINRKRFAGDWVIRAGYGGQNLDKAEGIHAELTRRAKLQFDPDGKFEPNAFCTEKPGALK